MERKTKQMALGILLITVFLMSSNYGASVAFPPSINGEYFSMLWKRDNQTEIPQQMCTFTVREIFTGQDSLSRSDNFTSYANENSTEWHTETVRNLQDKPVYHSMIYDSNITEITTYSSNTTGYMPYKDNVKSLMLEHKAMKDYTDSGPSAYYVFDGASIGEVSFDALILMAATTPVNISQPIGEFMVGLGHSDDLNDTFNMYFRTDALVSQGKWAIGGYIDKLNPATDLRDECVQIFEGYDGFFNWLHVNIFFDAYNDVYNVSVAQYKMEGDGYQVDPEPYVFRGNRYDQDNWKTSYHGARYVSTQLFDSIRFSIASKDEGIGSKAFIDNVNIRTYRFPAVYADVTLTNSTSSSDLLGGEPYMNKTAISAYQPPKYPDLSMNIGFNADYTKNILNPGLLTHWPYAPSWLYSFPLVVSELNHDLNIKSILNVVNDPKTPIEKMGVLHPLTSSTFYTGKLGGPLASQYFEFKMEESNLEEFDYIFKARYSNNYLRVQYYNDPIRIGLIKQITLSPDSIRNDQKAVVLVEFRFAGGEQSDIPGYPHVVAITVLGTTALYFYVNRKKKLIEKIPEKTQ